MRSISYTCLKKELMNHGYSKSAAQSAIEVIRRFSSELLLNFMNWLEYGRYHEVEIDDITLGELIQKMHMEVIQAFLVLDWLEKDPFHARLYLSMLPTGESYGEEQKEKIREQYQLSEDEEKEQDSSDIVLEEVK